MSETELSEMRERLDAALAEVERVAYHCGRLAIEKSHLIEALLAIKTSAPYLAPVVDQALDSLDGYHDTRRTQ